MTAVARHHALQRMAVRMLYDAELARAVFADPERVLGAAGLDAEARRLLLAVDPRAFRTDPLRARRTLRVLTAELKASTTLALAATRSLAFLDGFFASDELHAAIAERRALWRALGAYLVRACRDGRLDVPILPEVIALELALAFARRDARRPAGGDAEAALVADRPVGLAPGVAVGWFAEGTLEAIQVTERYLFEVGLMPAMVLADDAPRLEPPRAVPGAPRPLLLVAGGGGVSLTAIEEDVARVLAALPGRPSASRIAGSGPPARFDEVMAGCASDGLLEARGDG